MNLDGEALDDDRSVGKGTKDTLSNDIKDTRRECACQCDGKVDHAGTGLPLELIPHVRSVARRRGLPRAVEATNWRGAR